MLVPRLGLSMILLFLFGCTGGRYLREAEVEKTCLVLSVGSTKGIAHVGAIDAIKELDINVDCVFGNSIGSVVGGVYAYNPSRDLGLVFKRLYQEYEEKTEEEVIKQSKKTGFLIGVGLTLLTGGVFGLETLIGTALGAYVGATSVEVFDNDRFERVLDDYFYNANIENLPIPFATSYKVRDKTGLALYIADRGNLAEAISRSSNNKYIFKNTNLKYIDPGVDRISIVPIEEAYNTFQPTRIIAINVSGSPSIYTKNVKCKVIEIKPYVNELEKGSEGYINSQIQLLYESGYNSTKQVLSEL